MTTHQPRPRRGRRGIAFALFVVFIVVPLVEIYVIIQVAHVIGGWRTLLLLVADAVFGSWLVKREGGRAWRALVAALGSGRMPAAELADGGLILVGGTLMIAPGFVTDVLGTLLVLPFTRPISRRLLTAVVARRLVAIPFGAFPPPDFRGAPGAPRDDTRPGPGSEGPVVRGEVVDDD